MSRKEVLLDVTYPHVVESKYLEFLENYLSTTVVVIDVDRKNRLIEVETNDLRIWKVPAKYLSIPVEDQYAR